MKKAVMYGAGNIGRGFIGQLFSQSGYEVVFLDINPVIIDRFNSDRCYPLKVIEEGEYKEVIIKNVRGVNAIDMDMAADEIASADIMASAVGVNILPRIVKTLAAGFKKRWANGNFNPLNIIICENLIDANHYLEKLIKQELNEDECEYFNETIGLVEASIGRMVPVVTPEMQQGNPLVVCVESYCELPVDKDAFKGKIPEIINLKPFSPFNFYIQRKLYMHNMAHALASYIGFYKDKKYIWEAMEDPTIKLMVLRALLESSMALSAEHGVDLKTLYEFSEDLIYRFGNKLLGDTIERVGKDPVRKLSGNDRMIGSSSLCIKHDIAPVYISLGIAAGFMFAPPADDMALKVQQTVLEHGIEKAITEYCGIDNSNPMFGTIIQFYDMFKNGLKIEEIFEKAEKIKRLNQK